MIMALRSLRSHSSHLCANSKIGSRSVILSRSSDSQPLTLCLHYTMNLAAIGIFVKEAVVGGQPDGQLVLVGFGLIEVKEPVLD